MKERSRSYPGLALDEACEQVLALEESSAPWSRPELTRALGYPASSGRGARAVSAVVAYGLIDRRSKRYSLSEIGRAVRKYGPGNDTWSAAVRRAFKQPALFADLLQFFGPRGEVPHQDDLAEILVRQFEITEKASSLAASVFLRSGLYARALAPDGRILLGESFPSELFGGDALAVSGRRSTTSTPPKSSYRPPSRIEPPPPATPPTAPTTAPSADEEEEWKRAFHVELPNARLTLEIREGEEGAAVDTESLLLLFQSFASR